MLSERVRGLPLIWTPDVNWFNNDWLGPTPHVHDDATEIAFLAQGSLEIEIGGSKRIYNAGEFIIMPPNKYHNYWFNPASDETACFFVAVAPNHKHNRLRHEGFTPDNYEGDAPHGNVYNDEPLPSNEHFEVEKITLAPGESSDLTVIDFKDRIIYVVSGTAHLRVNTLAGTLAANQYQHIPATTPHQFSNPGYEPLVVISMIVTDPFTVRGTLPADHE